MRTGQTAPTEQGSLHRLGAASSGALPELGLLRFAGADALSFLQGQITHDTRRLAAGEPLLAAYLTSQGRVLALLRLLPHSSGVLGVLPRALAPPMQERMRKFVLRAKVTIEDASAQYAVAAQHGAQALAAAGLILPDAGGGYLEREGIGIVRIGSGAERYLVVGPAAKLGERGLAEGAEAARTARDWRLADIRAGLPQIYPETSELFVAQMLNLDLIDGISFTKGCFTGQEIIARTQHLGRIKRRMHRLRLPPGAWAIGAPLQLADGRSGRLTELGAIEGAFEALAVLSGAEAAQPPVGPVEATELPLPYSLAAAT